MEQIVEQTSSPLGRVGRWMPTQSGKKYWPMDPRPNDPDLLDIAHGLACENRFNGHTEAPYSVAQHSVVVAMILMHDKHPVPVCLAGLMHDASEAYIKDIPSPIKEHFPGYSALEDKWDEVIAAKYGFPYPLPEEVKEADMRALALERRDLFSNSPEEWSALVGIEPPSWFQSGSLVPWQWEYAKAQFLGMYTQLTAGWRR